MQWRDLVREVKYLCKSEHDHCLESQLLLIRRYPRHQ